MAKTPTPAELLPGLNYKPPEKGWMDVKPDFRPGTYCNPASPKWMEWINYPYPAARSIPDDNWALPQDWKEIVLEGMEAVSYTHLRAHETDSYLVCRLLL